MINSRFYGESMLDTADGSQTRNVLILSPFLNTSGVESEIDYDHALVVDLQTMEFDVKVQLEEMMTSVDANSFKTFLEYAEKAAFRNGDNVMKWLFNSKSIRKVSVDKTNIVMGGAKGAVTYPLREINDLIRSQAAGVTEAGTTVTESYSDASLNQSNAMPAMIERSGGQKEVVEQIVSAPQPVSTAPVADQGLTAEIEARMERMESAISSLTALLEAQAKPAEAPKKRGRPKKAQ